MQTYTIIDSVRFRAAMGEAIFFDPFSSSFRDNTFHTEVQNGQPKGTWVTLDAGATATLVFAYPKADTYALIVNEQGEGPAGEGSYGVVVRELSLQNILEKSVVGDLVLAEEVATSESVVPKLSAEEIEAALVDEAPPEPEVAPEQELSIEQEVISLEELVAAAQELVA